MRITFGRINRCRVLRVLDGCYENDLAKLHAALSYMGYGSFDTLSNVLDSTAYHDVLHLFYGVLRNLYLKVRNL